MIKHWFFVFVVIDILVAIAAGIAGDFHLKDTAQALIGVAGILTPLLCIYGLFEVL